MGVDIPFSLLLGTIAQEMAPWPSLIGVLQAPDQVTCTLACRALSSQPVASSFEPPQPHQNRRAVLTVWFKTIFLKLSLGRRSIRCARTRRPHRIANSRNQASFANRNQIQVDRGGIEPPTLGPVLDSPACKAGVRTAELPAHRTRHQELDSYALPDQKGRFYHPA